MYRGKNIGVVVPAFNEENLIAKTLGSMPNFVDRMFIINDGSTDQTKMIIEEFQINDPRIILINHKKNKGLGQSLIDGYIASKESDVDITAVMAGDNQMCPDDLPALLDQLIDNSYDYIKGNRLLHQDIPIMPRYRFFGNALLTLLTKFATGYYAMMDPQCGYTAIRNTALARIPIEKMTKGYGYNADILCMLNIQRFRVNDIEVRPVYGFARSKIKLWKYIPQTSWLLVKLFFRRIWKRYFVLDFHPLVLFYAFSIFNVGFIILPLTIRFVYLYFTETEFPINTLNIIIYTFLVTFQSILFAIWMDMDYNKEK